MFRNGFQPKEASAYTDANESLQNLSPELEF